MAKPEKLLYEQLDFNTLTYEQIQKQLYQFIYGDTQDLPQHIRTQKDIDTIIAESIRRFEGSMRPEMAGGLLGIGKKQTEVEVINKAVEEVTKLIKEGKPITDKDKNKILKPLQNLLPKEYTTIKEFEASYNEKLQKLQAQIADLKKEGQVSQDKYNEILEQLKQYLPKTEESTSVSPLTTTPQSFKYASKILDAYQTANEKKLFYTFLYIAEHLWTKLLKVPDTEYNATMTTGMPNLKTYLTPEELKAIKEKALFKAATTEALKEKAEAFVITPFYKLNRNLERLIKSWVPYRFMYYTIYDQDPEQIESFKDKIFEFEATRKLETGSFDRMMLSMTQLIQLASINDEYKKAIVKDLEGVLGYKIDTSSVEATKKGGAGMTVVAYVEKLSVPSISQKEAAKQIVTQEVVDVILKSLEVEKLTDNVTNLITALTKFNSNTGDETEKDKALVNPIVDNLVDMLDDTAKVVEEVIRGEEQPNVYDNPMYDSVSSSRPASPSTSDITKSISELTKAELVNAYGPNITIAELLDEQKLAYLGLQGMTDDQKRCYILAYFFTTIHKDNTDTYFILREKDTIASNIEHVASLQTNLYDLFIKTLKKIKNLDDNDINTLYGDIKEFLIKTRVQKLGVDNFKKFSTSVPLKGFNITTVKNLFNITQTDPYLIHFITPDNIRIPNQEYDKMLTNLTSNNLLQKFIESLYPLQGGSQNIITSSNNDTQQRMPGGAPNPANPNSNPAPTQPPASPQQEPILTPAKINEDVDLAKSYLKKSNQLQQLLSDVKSTWSSYVNVTPQKKFKDLKISILLDSLLSEAKKETGSLQPDASAKQYNVFNTGLTNIDNTKTAFYSNTKVAGNVYIVYNFITNNSQSIKSELEKKRKDFVSQLEELATSLENNTKLFPSTTYKGLDRNSILKELANKLKGFVTAPAVIGNQPEPTLFFKAFDDERSNYYIVDIKAIEDFLVEIRKEYNEIPGYTLEEIKGTHAYLQKSAESIKKDLVDKLTQVSTEYSKLIDELTKLSKRYATFNPSIKNRILLELEPKDGSVPKVAAIMENINTLIGKIKADIDTNKSNFEKAAEGMKTTKAGGGYLLCDHAFLTQLGGAPATEPDPRKEIDTLLSTNLKEPITTFETLIKTFVNNLQKSSDPVFALTTQGNESLFNTLFNKYRESKTDTSKGEYVAAMELAEGLEANNLLPREVLKVNYFDKTVFIFASLFIRLLALTLVDLLIDKDKLQKLSYTFLSYIGIYIGIFYVFLFIVNIDDYKLRIIFNYVNMHANASVAVMHPAIVAVFGAIIYYVMLNINKGDGYTVSTDEDRVRLKYKIQVLSLVIWMFTSLLVLLM